MGPKYFPSVGEKRLKKTTTSLTDMTRSQAETRTWRLMKTKQEINYYTEAFDVFIDFTTITVLT
jgi:hypothetical protein